MQNKISYINSSFDEQIAYSKDDLKSQTTIFFFGGYSSSMDGTKATALSKWCIENKFNFLRFDYSGHGVSKGRFEDTNNIFQRPKSVDFHITEWNDKNHINIAHDIKEKYV